MLILELVQNLRTETNGYKLNCIDNRRQNRDNLSLGKLHRTIEIQTIILSSAGREF